MAMKHSFLAFPAGATGVALLLLRAAVAIALVAPPYGSIPPHSSQAVACDLLALAVATGFRTRMAASIAVVVALAVAVAASDLATVAASTFFLQAVALTMIGPGAASIDARLFGRRTVHLRP